MTEFHADVAERTALKKRPPVTKGNGHMTEREWHNLNGTVKSYQLNQPKTWVQFKALPKELQQQYLTNLQNAFNVGVPQLADMFGKVHQTVRNYCEKENITLKPYKRHRTKAEQDAWDSFFDNEPQAPITDLEPSITNNTPQGVTCNTASSKGSQSMKMERLHIQFSGVTNPMEMVTLLTAMVGGKAGTLSVSFVQEGD